MLVDILGWKSFSQNDLGQSICLDCIYDSVTFCVNKGFNWTEISCIIKLVCEMLKAAECEYMRAFQLNTAVVKKESSMNYVVYLHAL